MSWSDVVRVMLAEAERELEQLREEGDPDPDSLAWLEQHREQLAAAARRAEAYNPPY